MSVFVLPGHKLPSKVRCSISTGQQDLSSYLHNPDYVIYEDGKCQPGTKLTVIYVCDVREFQWT